MKEGAERRAISPHGFEPLRYMHRSAFISVRHCERAGTRCHFLFTSVARRSGSLRRQLGADRLRDSLRATRAECRCELAPRYREPRQPFM